MSEKISEMNPRIATGAEQIPSAFGGDNWSLTAQDIANLAPGASPDAKDVITDDSLWTVLSGNDVQEVFDNLDTYLDTLGTPGLPAVLAEDNEANGASIVELASINNTINDFELLAPIFNGTFDEINFESDVMHIFTELSTFDGSVIYEISANPAGENSGFKIYDLFGSWNSVIESFQPSDNYKSELSSAGGVIAAMRWTNVTTSDYASISTASNPNAVDEGIIYLEQLGIAHTLLQIGQSDNGINGFDLETAEMLVRCLDYIDISKIKCVGDVAVDDTSFGIIQKSANAHYWRQTISNLGVATWTDLGTSLP